MKYLNMRHFFLTFLSWFLIALQTESTKVDRSSYIVHMDKSAMPKAFLSHSDWYSATIDSLEVSSSKSSDPDRSMPRILYAYENAMHGFSAVLSSEELQKLQNSLGFITAYSDKIIKLHTTRTPEFLSLNSEYGLWPASNYGKGVIIGLMDTGVWPESKSYKDDGMAEVPTKWKGICQHAFDFNSSMCNKKLIGARYFSDGAKAANLRAKTDKDSPRDFQGHGTHTSTTAAGNYVEGVSAFGYAKGTARGIAPRAHLAMYQIFADVGASSDFVAAMDQAIADGVDVISISQGLGSTPLYEDSIAIPSFAAMEKGIFVSTSAGNSGPFPNQVENGAPWLLTVGASTIDRQDSAIFTLGNGVSTIGWSQFPANALLEDVPLLYNKTLLACNSSELLSPASGKIIICSEELGYITEQIQAVTASKVAGAIIISSDTQYIEFRGITCPGVVIKPAQTTELMNYVKSSSNPTVTIKFQQDILGVKPAPAVAHYSSRGPSPTYPNILKPDLIAPGSNVLAAYMPGKLTATLGNIELQSNYAFNSGTSMASPHAAGVAAMLKGAHPEWSPAVIRSAMMTTASQLGNDFKPIRDNGANLTFATPLDTGAGQINPNKALDPGLVYDVDAQDYVNHLCFMNFTMRQITIITRLSEFNCSSAADLNYPSFMAFFKNTSSSSFEFQRTVTNVGNGGAIYKAKVKVPRGSAVSVIPDTLVFSEKYQKVSYSVVVDIKRMEKAMAHGSLVWEQLGGNHTVRSPIVVYRKI